MRATKRIAHSDRTSSTLHRVDQPLGTECHGASRRPKNSKTPYSGEVVAGRRTRRHTFTIIELLVALAISALLITATLGVVANMSRDLDRLKKVHHKPAWQVNLEQQLQRDLANARRYELTPTQLTLIGHAASTSPTSTPTLRPSRIEYEILSDNDESWLIRRAEEIGGAHTDRNLACQRITKLQKVESDGTLTDSTAGDMSSGIELQLTCEDSEPITIRSLR